MTAFNVGNYPKAEEYLKKALTLKPSLENNSNVKSLIGLSALYSGDFVTARAYISNETLLSTQVATTKIPTQSIISQIVNWEKIGKKTPSAVKELPAWVGFLIFFSFAAVFTVAFFAYIFIKKRRPLKMAFASEIGASVDEEIEEGLDFKGFDDLPSDDFPSFEEDPSDMPTDEEVQKKLENLLGSEREAQESKKTKVVEDPTKVVEGIKEDPSEDDLFELTRAIQEILFNESDSSDK